MVLICAPEDSARTAALLSNAVDLIETPPPDAVARLKQGGMKIETNVTPHVWNYHPSMVPGSPWTDIRLRKAANLAIDRDSIVKLLNGLATPAYGQVDRTSPWFGKPTFEIKYAPDEARKLVTAAGFSKAHPLKTKFVVASGGTGQMLSLPMNEAIQEMFKDVFIDVEFKVVELEAMYTAWRGGAKADMNKDITANNIAYVTSDPFYAINRFFASDQGRAGWRELELLQERRGRPADHRGKEHLRSSHAGRAHGTSAREGGRRRGTDLGRPRHQPARAVAEDQVIRPGPALVPGPDDDQEV